MSKTMAPERGRKRKLNLKVCSNTSLYKFLAPTDLLRSQTTYYDPPRGYNFLPVGTPDLAELCKKKSRERELPVSVVNVGHNIAPSKRYCSSLALSKKLDTDSF